jgi:hypothetical protein
MRRMGVKPMTDIEDSDTSEEYFVVDKLEAAKRQLLTAIYLYKHDMDTVSTYTLTMAAYNILRSLNDGRAALMKDYITDHIKPGMEKTARDLMNRNENFFKHADKDPDAVLKVHTKLPVVFLWEACEAYRKLANENPAEMVAYNIWFKIQNSRVFKLNNTEKLRSDFSKALADSMGKEKFMDLVAKLITQKDQNI